MMFLIKTHALNNPTKNIERSQLFERLVFKHCFVIMKKEYVSGEHLRLKTLMWWRDENMKMYLNLIMKCVKWGTPGAYCIANDACWEFH